MSATLAALPPGRARDAAAYAIGGRAPSVALRPESRGRSRRRWCASARDAGSRCVPWGGGVALSLETAPPPRYDVALDLGGLRRIVTYDPDDFTVTAECGITLAELRARARRARAGAADRGGGARRGHARRRAGRQRERRAAARARLAARPHPRRALRHRRRRARAHRRPRGEERRGPRRAPAARGLARRAGRARRGEPEAAAAARRRAALVVHGADGAAARRPRALGRAVRASNRRRSPCSAAARPRVDPGVRHRRARSRWSRASRAIPAWVDACIAFVDRAARRAACTRAREPRCLPLWAALADADEHPGPRLSFAGADPRPRRSRRSSRTTAAETSCSTRPPAGCSSGPIRRHATALVARASATAGFTLDRETRGRASTRPLPPVFGPRPARARSRARSTPPATMAYGARWRSGR